MQNFSAQELKHCARVPHMNAEKLELCLQEISEEYGRQAHLLMRLTMKMQVVLTMRTE